MEGPLDGIRVLDACQMFAGPMCAMRLGDLGADVLKVEPPDQGEYNRSHGLPGADLDGESVTFASLNRNKRSITINLKHALGREVLDDLVRKSDVFVQNFRVGTAERIGVGYERLRKVNPRLVYCSITGYGSDGPYADRPGQDLVIQGYSGSMWSVGAQDDPPTPSGIWAADGMSGYQAAIGVLAGIIARERTGTGQKIEVSMLAVVMDCQIQELTAYLNTGILPTRTSEASAHAAMPAPYGVYKTADAYITLPMAPLDVLGKALESDRLRELMSWSDGVRYRDEVIRIVRSTMLTRTTDQWLEILYAHKLWAGPVYTYADLVNDPHISATGMVTSVDHPTAGTVRMPNVPIQLSVTHSSIRRPPPTLSQHTDEILRETLGYSKRRIEQLHQAGAV